MGPDRNVHGAGRDALFRLREVGGHNEARGLGDVHRKAPEPVGKCLGVLAGEQRGWHDDGDLLAVHDRHEGGPQCNFGLAEPHIAAHKTVHRPPGGEVLEHLIDGRLLVLGLCVRKASGELVVVPVPDRKSGRFTQLALGCNLDELARDLADAALQSRLACLPVAAAQSVELDPRLLRTIAGQELDILHWQEKLVAACVSNIEAIVGRPRRLDRRQSVKPPDTMVHVDHEVAGREARNLGDEILGATCAASRTNESVAQYVLLADDREIVRFESLLQTKNRKPDLGLGSHQQLREIFDIGEVHEPVVGEHVAHALARALAPERNHHPLSGRLERVNVGGDRIEHV